MRSTLISPFCLVALFQDSGSVGSDKSDPPYAKPDKSRSNPTSPNIVTEAVPAVPSKSEPGEFLSVSVVRGRDHKTY